LKKRKKGIVKFESLRSNVVTLYIIESASKRRLAIAYDLLSAKRRANELVLKRKQPVWIRKEVYLYKVSLK